MQGDAYREDETVCNTSICSAPVGSKDSMARRGSDAGRYRRRNSVTKYSLDQTQSKPPKSEPRKQTISLDSYLGKTSSHEEEEKSFGHGSIQSDSFSHTDGPHRSERYRRRGSVTKYSLDTAEVKNLEGHSSSDKHEHPVNPYGYGDDETSNCSSQQQAEHRRNYRRRGSVTKYSLEPQEREESANNCCSLDSGAGEKSRRVTKSLSMSHVVPGGEAPKPLRSSRKSINYLPAQ